MSRCTAEFQLSDTHLFTQPLISAVVEYTQKILSRVCYHLRLDQQKSETRCIVTSVLSLPWFLCELRRKPSESTSSKVEGSAQFHNLLKTKQKQTGTKTPTNHRCWTSAAIDCGMKDSGGVKWLYPGADSQESSNQEQSQGKEWGSWWQRPCQTMLQSQT